MKKVPISIIIDDPAPGLSLLYKGCPNPTTADGRPMLEFAPNSFLDTFCDVIEANGIRGKFSVVPMPANRGDIINGISGVAKEQVDEWLYTVKTRVAPRFAICPEMLSHSMAVDLTTGESTGIREDIWASTQDRTTLTPYISKALALLKDAGFDVFGVTSPFSFGIEVEDEYAAAISQAVYDVTGKTNAWYFLRSLRDSSTSQKPWVQLEEDGRCLVSIPSTTDDYIWRTMDTTEDSQEYVSQVADLYITADGKAGAIIDVLANNGYPIICTHWHSLISNGLGTGMRVLDEIGKRVSHHLSDRVEWKDFGEIMDMVLADKENYPKPSFE